MTLPLRRAAAYAFCSLLALTAPFLGPFAAAPFAVVAAAAYVVRDGPLFRLLAFPWDEQAERLRTFVGFAGGAAGLAVLVPALGLPVVVYVATVLALAFGDLGYRAVLDYRESRVYATAGFGVLGTLAAVLGQLAVVEAGATAAAPPTYAFFATTAALLAALLRAVFTERDSPLLLAVIALLLWLFWAVADPVSWTRIAVALALTVGFGALSFAVGSSSIPGLLTGVFLGLLAVVLGGYGWFAVLITFFGLGSFATKYRYEEKESRGVAEENEGARGSGNVLGNSAAALVALLLFASADHLPWGASVFLYAYLGSVATALADTLSSEIGGLYGPPRLLTTLEPVQPGTDGGVTWQGELAGVAGATVIALIGLVAFSLPPLGVAIVVAGGLVGMTVDSLVGATLEGDLFGNQSVNFIATASGGVAVALIALLLL
ncbi:DUF92 domain-containing protein [Salarchaeum sp. JOR-1]|uniref:DUF92 domain-containing protein n=1 Tax=Salarchaeum sp. JOR-1 TaxID=2599399 RepID=UPI001198633D|nr:DUF92 domain-containing protein [Salarchaeum sp. JOR-1]QDX40655.1 DUF92 domain-containing protein [Salarchaeum sp. JOR-1]